MTNKPLLVIGLGNPGKEYESTYHNAGTLFVDYFLGKISSESREKNPAWKEKSGTFSYTKADGIIFVKPLVFMNDSGKAVKSAMNYFKTLPEQILVVHDDSDIAAGEYKFSLERGSAGHRGVESTIKFLGGKNFWRLRIGVRNKKNAGAKRIKASDLVLKKITKSDMEAIKKTFEEVSKTWLS
ncbi:MAG: aminoacyl-tRNA hydrolase [Candidatus Wolfebacteria bacterium]|nr:aminoacyl-tRNA hydrolase [Candidatus Wolfebacteria bacterium]